MLFYVYRVAIRIRKVAVGIECDEDQLLGVSHGLRRQFGLAQYGAKDEIKPRGNDRTRREDRFKTMEEGQKDLGVGQERVTKDLVVNLLKSILELAEEGAGLGCRGSGAF